MEKGCLVEHVVPLVSSLYRRNLDYEYAGVPAVRLQDKIVPPPHAGHASQPCIGRSHLKHELREIDCSTLADIYLLVLNP